MTDENEAYDMAAARKLWRKKGHNTKKAARTERHKKLTATVDRRHLRATGRTEQFNFKCKEGLRERAKAAADAAGVSLGAWMEVAVEAAMAQSNGKEPVGNA